MNKRNRIFAFVLAVSMAFVLLFSVFYIAVNSDHDCVGEHCQVCCRIAACENTLKTLSGGAFIVAFAVATVYILIRIIEFFTSSVIANSLVALKVKLTN